MSERAKEIACLTAWSSEREGDYDGDFFFDFLLLVDFLELSVDMKDEREEERNTRTERCES